jgi:translocation and assembly module TamB
VRRGGRIALLGGGALLATLAGTVLWLLNTQAGARFAVARAEGLLAPRLQVASLRGTLAGPLHVEGLRWQDPDSGVNVTLAQSDLDVALLALLRGKVHIRTAALAGLQLDLVPSPDKPPEEPNRHPLDPPLDILVDSFTLRDARVVNAGTEVVNVREAKLAGAWTRGAVAIRQLDVEASQGEVHFAGNVSSQLLNRDVYDGKGSGRFRWRIGEQQLAGTLEADAADANAALTVALSEPMAARLVLSLQQQDELPWKYTLQVPAFDPRTNLLPDSSLSVLRVDLEGSGTLTEATTRGNVLLNTTPLEIRTLHARRTEDALALDGALGFGAGSVTLDGTLQTGAEPLSGHFALQWQDIAIPPDLAGQDLRTAGRVTVDGTLDAYSAVGDLKLGPPRRLADIQLRLNGTPQAVQLAKFDVVQPQGRLAVAGVVQLQPQIGWTLAAAGNAFDPGAVLSEWPGRLDFRLATNGRLLEQGPEATFALQDLRGQLRGRRLAGTADLQLAADRTLVGKADLSSGASRVTVDATRDAQDVAQAQARIDVASLADWLPDARGSLRGTIDAHGAWPDMTVTANLRAVELALDANSVRDAQLDLDITRPLQPAGRVNLTANGIALEGFDFTRVTLNAEGDQARHSARLDASGPRVTLGVDVAGGLADGTWTGNVSRLQVAAPDVARLALQAPFDLRASATGGSMSQACLADGDIRLCVEGSATLPALQVKYSVHALPLKLAQVLVELPIGVEGTLEGEGDFSRDAQGAMAGNAQLRSASGRLIESVVGDEEARELLKWRDLAVDASLQGEQAQVTARAALNDQGSLDARVAATSLTSADPQLDGKVTLQLPGIGVVEAFVPQLLNVQGALALDARFAGSLNAPRIDGEARLSKLGFDLPLLGLKPREGEIVARAAGTGDQPIALEGSLNSGEGKLSFKGTAQLDGQAQVQVTGSNVLAADIPGVKVTLTPDLTVNRTATRTDLQGSVRIPSADVDLQRLPSAKKARSTSPDVVVVDDPAAVAASQSAPLQASINLTLGDAVKLKGYGLDATVGGELDVRERPGEPTTASGELRVAGKYQAYGQDLTIQQGQLLYAGTPIDNPRLAIIAVRQVDTVTAGFRVNGSARTPELSVFSDPAMGQANALSYIVAGKPLDQIGSGTGEGDALQSAARQLGTAAGGLLAKNVGKRLGVDEFGIKDSASIGGAALTVGQYLSPRLYLGYGVGLFEPGQVVTLRYRLSRSLALEAEQGTLNSRASIEFRKEK